MNLIDGAVQLPVVADGVAAADGPALVQLMTAAAFLALVPARRLLQPQGLRDVYVRPGKGSHGVGLIAIRSVPKRARICGCEALYAEQRRTASLLWLPAEVRATVHELWDGVDRDGTCTVPRDFEVVPLVSFLNHAAAPNCYYDDQENCIRASRRLRKGEEATVDYRQYQEADSYTYQQVAAGFRGKPKTYL